MQHHPLVMPGYGPTCFGKYFPAGMPGRRELVADLVVKFQHRQMRLRDQKIFVVAMIAYQREPFGLRGRSLRGVLVTLPAGTLMVLPINNFGPGVLPSASPGLRA